MILEKRHQLRYKLKPRRTPSFFTGLAKTNAHIEDEDHDRELTIYDIETRSVVIKSIEEDEPPPPDNKQ